MPKAKEAPKKKGFLDRLQDKGKAMIKGASTSTGGIARKKAMDEAIEGRSPADKRAAAAAKKKK